MKSIGDLHCFAILAFLKFFCWINFQNLLEHTVFENHRKSLNRISDQTVLPDRSVSIGQNWLKMSILKHSKGERCSLRSQCRIRLFLWFSNTVWLCLLISVFLCRPWLSSCVAPPRFKTTRGPQSSDILLANRGLSIDRAQIHQETKSRKTEKSKSSNHRWSWQRLTFGSNNNRWMWNWGPTWRIHFCIAETR